MNEKYFKTIFIYILNIKYLILNKNHIILMIINTFNSKLIKITSEKLKLIVKLKRTIIEFQISNPFNF